MPSFGNRNCIFWVPKTQVSALALHAAVLQENSSGKLEVVADLAGPGTEALEAPQPSIGSDVPISSEQAGAPSFGVGQEQQTEQHADIVAAAAVPESLAKADLQPEDTENMEEARAIAVTAGESTLNPNAPEFQAQGENMAEMLRQQLLKAQQQKASEEKVAEPRRGPARSHTPIPIPNPDLKPSTTKASFPFLQQETEHPRSMISNKLSCLLPDSTTKPSPL